MLLWKQNYGYKSISPTLHSWRGVWGSFHCKQNCGNAFAVAAGAVEEGGHTMHFPTGENHLSRAPNATCCCSGKKMQNNFQISKFPNWNAILCTFQQVKISSLEPQIDQNASMFHLMLFWKSESENTAPHSKLECHPLHFPTGENQPEPQIDQNASMFHLLMLFWKSDGCKSVRFHCKQHCGNTCALPTGAVEEGSHLM